MPVQYRPLLLLAVNLALLVTDGNTRAESEETLIVTTNKGHAAYVRPYFEALAASDVQPFDQAGTAKQAADLYPDTPLPQRGEFEMKSRYETRVATVSKANQRAKQMRDQFVRERETAHAAKVKAAMPSQRRHQELSKHTYETVWVAFQTTAPRYDMDKKSFGPPSIPEPDLGYNEYGLAKIALKITLPELRCEDIDLARRIRKLSDSGDLCVLVRLQNADVEIACGREAVKRDEGEVLKENLTAAGAEIALRLIAEAISPGSTRDVPRQTVNAATTKVVPSVTVTVTANRSTFYRLYDATTKEYILDVRAEPLRRTRPVESPQHPGAPRSSKKERTNSAGTTTSTPQLSQPTRKKEFTNSIGMKLVLIPAGEFMMGSRDEQSQYRVRITQPFYLGVYEVTQAEYNRVMGTNPSYFSSTGYGKAKVTGMKTNQLPVDRVSWNDAVAFCRKLSQKEGKIYRLPTEAEWEYACRAGSGTKRSFGDSETGSSDYGWFSSNSGGTTHPVGTKKPNDWGLHDMQGNVQEWCADWYDTRYYTTSPAEDPKGPASGVYRVLRGGSYGVLPNPAGSASRSRDVPSQRYIKYGFRVARTP